MAETFTGILAVDKPRGITSHDVVARVRRLTGQRRVGHAGTLDPIATGVLLVCLGDATRVSDDLMAGAKWYEARIAFGAGTDTDDAEGRLIALAPAPDLDAALPAALRGMIGAIQQVPPQFAAIKRAGVPAYAQARAGRAVPLEPRPVTISSLALLRIGTARFTFEQRSEGEAVTLPCADLLVGCSKGTYIRSLARDLGALLHCGAFMAALRRLASGSFNIRHCATLGRLGEAAAEGPAALRALLFPIDAALSDCPAAVLGPDDERRARSGMDVRLDTGAAAAALRLYSSSGSLIGVATRRGDRAEQDPAARATWHPDRVFARDI